MKPTILDTFVAKTEDKQAMIKHLEIPKFLVSRRYISAVIAFIVVFSVGFMLIYQPFSLAVWFGSGDMLRFSFTILFYILAIAILVCSRALMYAIQDRLSLTAATYVWWMMGENLLISLLYTLITVWVFPVEDISLPEIATRALMCVTLILAIPNGLVSFYAAYRTKCEELEATQYQLQRLGEDYRILLNRKEHELRTAETRPQVAAATPKMIHLYDNSGSLRLTIDIDALYYMESEDNYIKVYYKHNDKIASYMLRCRTRTVEQSLEGTSMVRCHRSYMVNVSKINHIKKGGKSRYIVLSNTDIKPIPVSKSYFKNLIEKIDNCNTSILAKQQKSGETTEPTSEVY